MKRITDEELSIMAESWQDLMPVNVGVKTAFAAGYRAAERQFKNNFETVAVAGIDVSTERTDRSARVLVIGAAATKEQIMQALKTNPEFSEVVFVKNNNEPHLAASEPLLMRNITPPPPPLQILVEDNKPWYARFDKRRGGKKRGK